MANKLTPDQLDPRNNLQYYTRAALRNADVWTDRNIRQEYSRLRDIAQKRIKRLAAAEPESIAYRSNVGKYAPVRELTTGEARALLPDLARFIAAKTGSVRGIREQRAKAVRTLQAHGFNVTKSNIKEFGLFMQEWRDQKGKRSRGSLDAAESWEFTEEHDIPLEKIKDDFNEFIRNRKKLEKYVNKRNKKGQEVTSADILTEFDKLKK